MTTQNQHCKKKKHVHELTGSTAVVRECDDCHNHRFCTVTGEAIQAGNNHVHEVKSAQILQTVISMNSAEKPPLE